MEQSYSRNTDIDVFRGVCMLLVILGHSIGTITDPINWYILSFHMPIFFFISGACLNLSKKKRTIIDAIAHKCGTLGYQYIVFSLLGLIIYWLVQSRVRVDLGLSLCDSLIGLLIGQNIVPGFWFVYDLFIISIVFILLQNFRFRTLILLGSFVLIFLFISFIAVDDSMLLDSIYRISGGGIFYSIGGLIGEKGNIMIKKISDNKKVAYLLVLLLLIVVGLSAFQNTPILMGKNEYGNIMLFLLGSVLACCAFSLLSFLIYSCSFLEYIGKNSILFLFIHFYILDASHMLYNMFFQKGLNNSFPYYFLHFIIALVGAYIFAWLSNRYLPWLKKSPAVI